VQKKSTCEKIDRKFVTTKSYKFVCLKQEKKGKEKEKKRKNGAPPAIEPMWSGSPEPGAAYSLQPPPSPHGGRSARSSATP